MELKLINKVLIILTVLLIFALIYMTITIPSPLLKSSNNVPQTFNKFTNTTSDNKDNGVNEYYFKLINLFN